MEATTHGRSTTRVESSALVEKSNRLDGCDVEAFAAAEVLTHHDIVFAKHVGTGLREASTVAVVGTRREAALLGADDPVNLIFRTLVTVRAVEIGRFLVGTLVEEFALFHGGTSFVIGPRSLTRAPNYQLLSLWDYCTD